MANLTKCMIKNRDDGSSVTAYFNPTEIKIDKSVPWQKHKSSKGDSPTLEFTDAEPRTMQVDLLFDTYETKEDVYATHIKQLEKYTLIIDDTKKRPPMCLFVWGSNFPQFQGVIKMLSVKYTMFLENGTPVRATATVSMMQADKVTKAKDKSVPIDDFSGSEAQEGTAGRIDNMAADAGTTPRAFAEANDMETMQTTPGETYRNPPRGGR